MEIDDIKEIKRADDLIVLKYNELVQEYKKLKSQNIYNEDEIKRLQLKLRDIEDRNAQLENDFDNAVEKRVEQKHIALKAQITQLKKCNEKHKEDKKRLKDELGKIDKDTKEKYEKLKNIFFLSSRSYYDLYKKVYSDNPICLERFRDILINSYTSIEQK